MNFFKFFLLTFICCLSNVIGLVQAEGKMKLVAALYNEKNVSRCAEYIKCLECNLQHKMIDKIHVLYDDSMDDSNNFLLTYLKTRPVSIRYIHGRPSYDDCFEYANKQFPNARVILANADIFFDETLNKLNKYDLTNKFLAFTRYDVGGGQDIKKMTVTTKSGKVRDNIWSQDVWIFSTPLKKMNKNAATIQLGVFGCDTAIAACAKDAGLMVINPCLSIYCYHLHTSQVRNYNSKDRPYKKLPQYGIPWTKLDGD